MPDTSFNVARGGLSLAMILGVLLAFSASPVFSEPVGEAEEAFDFPVRAFNDGNYEVAVRGFRRFIENFPDHEWAIEARYWKAESLLHTGKHREALNQLLAVIQRDPGFADGDVAERLAYAADQSGLREILGPNLSLRLLHEHPNLQHYVINWFYEEEPERVLARLEAIDPEQRTEEAQRLLDEAELEGQVWELVDRLEAGEWNRRVRGDVRRLDFELRDNVLALVAKRLWDRGDLDLILVYGRELPADWLGMDFSIYVAEAAIERGEWDLAGRFYQRLLDQLDFNPPEAAYGLAWLEFQEGNTERAARRLEPIAWERISGELGHEGLRLQGDVAYARGDYDSARDRYQRALERDLPEDLALDTRYWLGWSHLSLDQPAAALEQFRQLEGTGVISRAQHLEAHGIAAQRMGEWEEAERVLERALQYVDEPERSSELRYRLARVKFEQQKYDESQNLLADLRESSLTGELNRVVNLALVNLLYEQDDHREVRRILADEESLFRDHYPERYYALSAWSNRETGRVEQAAQDYRVLIREYPNSNEVQPALQGLFNLGLDHPDLLGFDEENYQFLLDRASSQRAAFMLRDWARHHQERGNTVRYRDLYQELLDRDAPRALHAEALGSLVESYLAEDDVQTAEQLLRDSVEYSPHPLLAGAFYQFFQESYDRREFERLTDVARLFEERFDDADAPPEIQFMMAEISRHEGDDETAGSRFERVIEGDADPDLRDQALYRLAELAHRDGRIDEGNDYLDRIEDPARLGGGEAIHYRIAILRYEGGRTEEALEAVRHLPEEPHYELLHGKILLKDGQVERARTTLARIDPGEQRSQLHPERLFWLARAHEELGDLDTAEEYLYEVRYRYPDWDQMDRLYERLITVLEELNRPEEVQRLEEQRARGQS